MRTYTFSFGKWQGGLQHGQGPYKVKSRKGQGTQAERPTADGGHGARATGLEVVRQYRV